MENTSEIFAINEVGDNSGRTYSGSFTVKTLLTRQDQFDADIRRRSILGPNPVDALEGLKMEAFMLGQLSVRVLKGPKIWDDTNGFLECEDINVIQKVFDECVKVEQARVAKIKGDAKEAIKQLTKEDQAQQAESKANG